MSLYYTNMCLLTFSQTGYHVVHHFGPLISFFPIQAWEFLKVLNYYSKEMKTILLSVLLKGATRNKFTRNEHFQLF